jgi:hypothetical protein
VVADIDYRRFQVRRVYKVTILPGVDIGLVLALVRVVVIVFTFLGPAKSQDVGVMGNLDTE